MLMFLLDSIGRSSIDRAPFTDISVFSLFNQSNAVAPGGAFDLGRDDPPVRRRRGRDRGGVGGVRAARHRARADSSPAPARQGGPRGFAESVAAHSDRARTVDPADRVACLDRGMAVTAAAVVLLVNITATFFASTPTLSPYLRGLPGDVHTVLLALIWLSFAQALVAVFAITAVSRWSADDSSGVLEMQLAEPLPRWGVLAERAAELTADGVADVVRRHGGDPLACTRRRDLRRRREAAAAPLRCWCPSRSPSPRSERCSRAGDRGWRLWRSRRSP